MISETPEGHCPLLAAGIAMLFIPRYEVTDFSAPIGASVFKFCLHL